ncbi:hypothetical protein [Sulfurovum sp.]|jgi:hypothetical protein|uniref:hypothetical protein n=1 Tax=Sulfurovum sp. TaxID=1969726 RepID=UPI002A36C056|nr:hypothetical protein [Sulfurovum sp.]MDY0402419.1 hypothetical protein [Sulfurovum sp.]
MAERRGMQKIEFYTSLDEIRELYNQGYVVLKILYEEMKKRRNWEMSYWSFCKYAKKELGIGEVKPKPVKSQIVENEPVDTDTLPQTSPDTTDPVQKQKETPPGPIILDPRKQDQKKIYNGSTKNIQRDEI